MKPSVGRVVHYEPQGEPRPGPWAAIITHVDPAADRDPLVPQPGLVEVGLTVFPPPPGPGDQFVAAALVMPGVPFADPPAPHSWRWPPRS